jgi:hypothetical protein
MSAPAYAASEYAIKAAYLYKFAAFVEWPGTSFLAVDSPLNLCIVGFDPFGAQLDRAVAGQKIGDHPVVAKRLERAHPDADCHIAYVAGSRAESVPEGLAAFRGSPTLTVTDQAMGSARGAIHFVLKDQRVRFYINDETAEQNRLSISSKLLRLALTVRPRKTRG